MTVDATESSEGRPTPPPAPVRRRPIQRLPLLLLLLLLACAFAAVTAAVLLAVRLRLALRDNSPAVPFSEPAGEATAMMRRRVLPRSTLWVWVTPRREEAAE